MQRCVTCTLDYLCRWIDLSLYLNTDLCVYVCLCVCDPLPTPTEAVWLIEVHPNSCGRRNTFSNMSAVVPVTWSTKALLIPPIILLVGQRSINCNEMFCERARGGVCVYLCVCRLMCCRGKPGEVFGCWFIVCDCFCVGGDRFYTWSVHQPETWE